MLSSYIDVEELRWVTSVKGAPVRKEALRKRCGDAVADVHDSTEQKTYFTCHKSLSGRAR